MPRNVDFSVFLGSFYVVRPKIGGFTDEVKFKSIFRFIDGQKIGFFKTICIQQMDDTKLTSDKQIETKYGSVIFIFMLRMWEI